MPMHSISSILNGTPYHGSPSVPSLSIGAIYSRNSAYEKLNEHTYRMTSRTHSPNLFKGKYIGGDVIGSMFSAGSSTILLQACTKFLTTAVGAAVATSACSAFWMDCACSVC